MNVTEDGLLSFGFTTYEQGCILFWCWVVQEDANNDGQIFDDLSILFFQESEYSIIALLGDGQGDNDFDDMAVRISVPSVVPLPPSMLLFAGALLGLGWVARKKKFTKTA